MKNIFVLFYLMCVSFFMLAQKQDTQEKELTVLPIVYYSPETTWAFGLGSVYQFRFKGESKSSHSSQISAGGIYTLKKQLYGIGIEARTNQLENYAVRFPKIELAFTKKFFKKWYIGPQLYFEDYNIQKVKEGGIIESENLLGINGGKISGIGVSFFYENRHNLF